MTTDANGPGLAPIYDTLVQERGDVISEIRMIVEQTQAEADEVLNWQDIRMNR